MRIRFDSLHAILLLVVVLACALAAFGWMREAPKPIADPAATAAKEHVQVQDSDESINPPAAQPKTPVESSKQESPVIPKQRETQPAPAAGEGVITGRVWTAQHEAAVGQEVVAFDPELTLRRPSYDGGDYERYRRLVEEYAAAVARKSGRAKTDASGQFRIEGLDKTRAYTLTAGSRYEGGAVLEFIAPGSEVELVLKSVPKMRGKVLLQSGEAARDFTVCLQVNADRPYVAAFRISSADGHFEFVIAEGRYRAWAEAAGMQSTEPIDVEVGANGAEVELTLAPACRATLIVTDLAGEPLGGMKVNIAAAPENTAELSQYTALHWNNMSTDNLGRVTVPAIAAGRYVAEVSGRYNDHLLKQEITLVKGEQEVCLQVDAGWRCTIKLLDSNGKPLNASYVDLASMNKDQGRAMEIPSTLAGTYVYRCVKAGKYRFSAWLPDGAALAREITISADNSEETVMARARGRLCGKVLALRAGGSVEGCQVDVRSGELAYASEPRLKADGRYRLRPVETGSYEVIVRDPANREILKETLVIAEGDNERDLSIDTEATLRVKLTTAVANAEFDDLYLDVRAPNDAARNVRVTFVGESGIATKCFLKAGEYWLLVRGDLASALVRVSLVNGMNELDLAVGRANCLVVVRDGGPDGVLLGDIVIDVNGQKVSNASELKNLRKSLKQGDISELTVEREGRRVTLRLDAQAMAFETLAAFKP